MNTVLSILYHEQRNHGQWSTPDYRGILVECRRWYADRPEYPVDDICLDAFVWEGGEQVEVHRARLPMEHLTDAQVQRRAIEFFDALLAKYVAQDASWWPLVKAAESIHVA